jgi:metalloendopeptidase OMA1, mitochondrial
MASIFFAFTRRPRPPTSLPRPFFRPAPRQQRAPFSATPRQRFYRRSPISLLRSWAARPTFLYEVGAVSGAGGLFYYSNLERVPMSGRLRFNMLSPEYERKMGYSTFHSIVEEFQGHILPGFAPEAQRVHRVLARLVEGLGKLGGDLAPAIGDTEIENWEVYVVDSKEANAFVVPG